MCMLWWMLSTPSATLLRSPPPRYYTVVNKGHGIPTFSNGNLGFSHGKLNFFLSKTQLLSL